MKTLKMNSLLKMILTIMLLKILIHMMNNFIKNKNNMNNIECGFNNFNNKKMNLTMNFIYILIIFILFDIEMMMFLPLIFNLKLNKKCILMINVFLLFMILSTLIEIKNNKILWYK